MMRQGDCEPGDELQPLGLCGAALTMLNFEGDRDKERLSDRTAAVTSTWCTPVGDGDGRVKVPPLLFE